ncbi:MAG: Dps family protein [Bacteroidota bacterium]|jgi:starvation-inducible DNA-binding protein
MKTDLNRIGLPEQDAAAIAEQLNILLANYSVFYQNARGYHWHIQGEKFFELHLKFEELYNNLLLKIDELAERILTLGHRPEFRFSVYLTASAIAQSKETADGRAAITEILQAFRILLLRQREILELAAAAGDEGTNALMSDYIREQEKLVWMYSAWLG